MASRSRSTCPIPTPPSSAPQRGGAEVVGGGTLSKDALYAPLSTYRAGDNGVAPSNKDDAVVPSSKKRRSSSRHSLSLQQSKSSSLPSLITALTSMGADLKTSRPHEHHLYRGVGGSVSQFGMGDDDRADGSMRGILENKLLNRSLVLVGGGVHAPRGKGGGGERGGGTEGAGVALGALRASCSGSGKRERKRAGGNGIFGSISNKKRKRLLRRIKLEKQSNNNQSNKDVADSELKMHDGDADVADRAPAQKEPPRMEKPDEEREKKSLERITPATNMEEKVGAIITTMHEMWIDYMRQLLSSSLKPNAVAATTNPAMGPPPSSLWLEQRKQIAAILAAAEHAGMPATILECTSRRHLVRSRCVVVDETKETWRVATVRRKGKEGGKRPKEKSEMFDSNRTNEKDIGGSSKSSALQSSHRWKIVMVPKRGTALEVDVPWDDGSSVDAVTVRLEG